MPMRRRSGGSSARRGGADVGAEHQQPPAGRAHREVQQPQQAGLARARRAAQPAEAALGDAEGEVAQRLRPPPPPDLVVQRHAVQSHHRLPVLLRRTFCHRSAALRIARLRAGRLLQRRDGSRRIAACASSVQTARPPTRCRTRCSPAARPCAARAAAPNGRRCPPPAAARSRRRRRRSRRRPPAPEDHARVEPRLSGYRPRNVDSADDARLPPRDDEIELAPRRGGALLGWLISLVILALLIWAAFVFRSQVMGAWPPSARLYAVLGLR